MNSNFSKNRFEKDLKKIMKGKRPSWEEKKPAHSHPLLQYLQDTLDRVDEILYGDRPLEGHEESVPRKTKLS